MKHARRTCSLAVALTVSSLAGCIPALPQGPAREPRTALPDTFGAGGGREMVLVDWRDLLADDHLVELIETALDNNQELQIAVQEALIERYEVMARRGEILPRIGIAAQAGLERSGEATREGVNEELAELDRNLQSYSFGLHASWEIDVFGRLRNMADAQARRYLASVRGRQFIVTQLVAEIASLYYELMALDRQLEVVTESLALQQAAIDAARLQWQAGRTSSLAVRRFEAELMEFWNRRYAIRQRIVETENRINFLVGRFPQPVPRSSDRFMDLTPRIPPAGLPSQLLMNRPDVQAAELRLEAARLDVEAARARFFPALSFDAAIGYESFDILRLVETPGSIFFDLFGNLTAPLFNRSAITAEYFSADARQRQAVIEYERSILSAYIEVVNRLNLVENLARSYEVQQRRVAQLRESIEIANRLFASARADYLEVLTARREALDAELELIETKQRQLSAVVWLYQALGGGWQRSDEPTTEPDAENGGEP